jgi:alpha-L-rhamnosidase
MESKDVESLGLTLNEMQTMFFMGFNPPMVMAAAEKLLALKKEWN